MDHATMNVNGKAARKSLSMYVPRSAGVLFAVLIIFVVFSMSNPYFLTVGNMLELFRSMSALAIMSLGLMMVIAIGEIDLSIGSMYGLCSMLMGVLWVGGMPFGAAFAVALLAGLVIGAITAVLTTYVRIPSFIVTLGMLNLLQGLTLLISGSRSINPEFATTPVHAGELQFFKSIGNVHLPFQIPIQILWLILFGIATAIVFNKTLFGFRIKAIGGNPEAAKLAGLPNKRYKIWVFALCGLFAAFAGLVDFSFIGSTSPTSGAALTFPVFAAVIIGGASLTGGKGSVLGTLIGALLLSVLANGLSLLGVGAYGQLVYVGLITIVAVAIDQWGNVIKNLKKR